MPSHQTHVLRLSALILVALVFSAAPIMAQVGADAPPPEPRTEAIDAKSPGLALTLSLLVPGGGQLYNGQGMKSLLHFAAGAVTMWASVAGFSSGDCQGAPYTYWDTFSERYVTRWTEGGECGAGYAWLAANMGVRVWSLLDARGSAASINRRVALTLRPTVLATARGPRLGISLLQLGL